MKGSSQKLPISKGMYAWNYIHAGSFILYVESLDSCHKFIMLPGPSEYFLTYEDFAKGIDKNILEFVEILPEDIYQETLSLLCPSGRPTLNA